MTNSFFAMASVHPVPGRGQPRRGCLQSTLFFAGARSRIRPLVLTLIALFLLLIGLQGQAAEYKFPGSLPAGCSASGITAGILLYNCGALTLAAGDSIVVTGLTQITIAGDFTVGEASQLNAGGPSSNLNLYVSGITFLGDYTALNGNIWATNGTAGTITTGANSQVVGNLTTTSAGVINIGNNGSVVGNLSTVAGAINVGDNGTITGNITTSSAGAITVGVNAKVSGFVSSTSGSGTGAGAITVGGGSTIGGGISTDAGAITVEVGGTVGGNVSTGDGAITVATNANVSGSVCTGNSGAITIGASATVNGNVETAEAGAITIGTKAVVTGDVKAEKAGDTTIAPDAKVGANRIGSACALPSPKPKTTLRITSRDWRQLFMR